MLALLIPLMMCMFLIVLASSLVVNSIIEFSKKTGIPSSFIAFFSLTIGNILPEFVTSIFTTICGINQVVPFNIISNIVLDLTLVIGIGLLLLGNINPKNSNNKISMYIVTMFFITCLSAIFYLDAKISELEGLILFLLYPIIFLFLFKESLKTEKTKIIKINIKNILVYFFTIPFGVAIIISNAYLLARLSRILLITYRIPDYIIGYLLGILTVTPEFVVSILSAIRKEMGILIGNILGTVMLDSTFVIGVPASITSITITNLFLIKFSLLIILSSLFLLTILDKDIISPKTAGVLLLAEFVIYSIIYLYI